VVSMLSALVGIEYKNDPQPGDIIPSVIKK